ncbi:hypothetical protein FOA52_014864 [Chlamydomonas sp. UWO 241]|nr:hypothetical protein FOA52_014864 [Chlamydomonas sp. UWO 241]
MLLLLRCHVEGAQPSGGETSGSDAERKHLRRVMQALKPILKHDDKPCAVRDECFRALLARGATGYDPDSPVVSRIICEAIQFARVPRLINEAILGLAVARQQQEQPEQQEKEWEQ